MTLGEITELVLDVVQDDSFEDSIPSYANGCLDFITQRYELDSLNSSDILTLSSLDNKVALPSNYMKGLYWAESDKNLVGTPNYYHDFKRFLRRNPGRQELGSLCDVCVVGKDLHYAKRCDTDVEIHFFEKPTYLSGTMDEPVCIPTHLHQPLFVNYIAWKLYDLIEDGIEDQKTNTQHYQKLFFSFLPDLELFETQTDEPEFVQDEWSL
jgi:hypothetical protein